MEKVEMEMDTTLNLNLQTVFFFIFEPFEAGLASEFQTVQ
jgi:hypothetical protein